MSVGLFSRENKEFVYLVCLELNIWSVKIFPFVSKST